MRQGVFILVLASVWLSGCREQPTGSVLANREVIAKRMPGDLKLEDRIPRDNFERKRNRHDDQRPTDEETLIQVGAHNNGAGKLVDSQGREIVFRTEIV